MLTNYLGKDEPCISEGEYGVGQRLPHRWDSKGKGIYRLSLFLGGKRPEGNSEETISRRREQNKSYLRSGCKGVEEIRERNLGMALRSLQ